MNRLVILVSALAAATAFAQPALPERPAATPTVQSGPIVYAVQPGDSLIKIAREHGVTVEDLRKTNNLTSDLIVAGRKLLIPSALAPASSSPAAGVASLLTAENQQLHQQLANVSAKLAAAAAKVAEMQPALAQVQTRLASREVQFKTVSGEKAALQRRLDQSEKRAGSLAATVAANAKDAERLPWFEQQLVELRVKLAGADRQLAAAVAKVAEIQPALAQAQTRFDATKAQLQTLSVANAALQQQLNESEKRAEALAVAVAANTIDAENFRQLEQQLAEVRQQLAEANRQLASRRVKKLEAQLAVSNEQMQALRSRLSAENEALQQQLAQSEERAEVLTATVAVNTNNSENVRQLEQQLAALQEKLTEADRQLASRSVQEQEGRISTLNDEMLALRARLNVYETKAIPYTAEERALFRAPAATDAIATDSLPRRKASRPTATLEASAERNLADGDFPQAEEKLVEVVRQDDKEVRAFCNLAIIQAAQERFAEAEQTIRKALALSPDDGGSLAVFGLALSAQKRHEEAFDALSRAATLKPGDAGIQTLLGIVLAEKGLRGQAETAFRKALQISPAQVDAHRNLAVIYLTQQPPLIELARWHYQKSLASGAPASPELENQLAAAAHPATPK